MEQLKCQDQSESSVYSFTKTIGGIIVECTTIYNIDMIAEEHEKATSRKEKRALADQYAALASLHNNSVKFKAFKTIL